MSELGTTLARQAIGWSFWEVAAVILAVAYLVLVIRQNIWCWVCAAVSTAIYVYLFIDARLYMESALNVFYLLMAVYGWYTWTRGRGNQPSLPVRSWPFKTHAAALVTIVLLSGISGRLLESRTDAAFPYIDSMTTWSAIWATFLVARKVLENWWYWLVIDFASIIIYWSRDLELTAILFVLYLLMIPFGLVSWHRSMAEDAV